MDVATIVGENLRRLRTENGISLSQLARMSGIAKATLSKLEAGRGNPTMATMFAIADALGTPLGELIAEHEPNPDLVRANDGPRVSRGAVESRYISRLQAGPDLIEIYELEVDSKRQEESLPHRSGVFEHVFVLDGPMLVGPSERLVELQARDYVSFRADQPHRYVAKGSGGRMLCLVHYPNGARALRMDGPAGSRLDALTDS